MHQYCFFRLERHTSLLISYLMEAVCHTLGYGYGICICLYVSTYSWRSCSELHFFQELGGGGKVEQTARLFRWRKRGIFKYWNKKLVWNVYICLGWRLFCSWFGPETIYSILKIQWVSLSLRCWVPWNIGHKWNKCKCSFRQLQINSWIECLSSCFDKKFHSQILPISVIRGSLYMPWKICWCPSGYSAHFG